MACDDHLYQKNQPFTAHLRRITYLPLKEKLWMYWSGVSDKLTLSLVNTFSFLAYLSCDQSHDQACTQVSSCIQPTTYLSMTVMSGVFSLDTTSREMEWLTASRLTRDGDLLCPCVCVRVLCVIWCTSHYPPWIHGWLVLTYYKGT